MKRRILAAKSRDRDAIAVIGMACRFPGGVASPHDLWRLLLGRVDAIRRAPPTREKLVELSGSWAGYLENIEQFDADVFALSPKEAATLDPQQRLLLEVVWEAFESAGLSDRSLLGSPTGVYVGMWRADYGQLDQPDSPWSGTGNLFSGVAAGRLAYQFGLKGPSLLVDTTSSSSLVAVHLACQHLRAHEGELAVAAGVNLILASEITSALSQMGALSPTGRCRSFDASGDGYVRAEGCGAIVLKRLSDAVRDGDQVLAVIAGSSWNHDGREQGLTAPGQGAQEEVIRSALAQAKATPEQITYVEAHGTGTPLGDSTELKALARALGRDGPPCLVGSVKANLGHAESAAGIAGVIKTILCLQHGQIPPQLHFQEPAVDLAGQRLEIPTEIRAWPSPRWAGVSSFGISGTNAHVVLRQAPEPARGKAGASPCCLPVVVSGHTRQALAANAFRLSQHLRQCPDPLPELAYTLAVGRRVFDHGLVLPSTREDAQRGYPELSATLEAFAARAALPALGFTTSPSQARGGLALLFPGQGSQSPSMGAGLYGKVGMEVFTRSFDLATRACERHLPEPLWPSLRGSKTLIDQTHLSQPALFVLESALCRQWLAWGLEPDLLLGHSLGELVVAHVAGLLDLDDASRLICARGRLMSELASAEGSMLAVGASEADVLLLIAKSGLPGVEIAALNSPTQTVVAGPRPEILSFLAYLSHQGRKARPVRVSVACHSSLMDPVLENFRAIAEQVDYRTGTRFKIVSSLTGRLANLDGGDLTSAEYWTRQLRETVRFHSGVDTAAALGITTFLECGPGKSLSATLSNRQELRALSSLRQAEDEPGCLASTFGALHLAGHRLDWSALAGTTRKVHLPTYAFQRRRYWLDSEAETEPGPGVGQQEGAWLEMVRAEVARLLRRDTSSVPADRPLKELGLDSLMAIELRNRLEMRSGCRLPAALVFDYADPRSLARSLVGQPGAASPKAATRDRPRRPGKGKSSVAIIALSLRAPGGCDSPSSLWSLLEQGSGLEQWQLDRWEGLPFPVSLLRGIERFDPGFFHISAPEAMALDPQQRLVLETSWEALEFAGLSQERLQGSLTGVYLGAMNSDFDRVDLGPDASGYRLTGSDNSVLSGRLSYWLDLRGPAISVNTACSSSLVAIHLACEHLALGECDLALAGGVSVMSTPTVLREYSHLQASAPDGRCKAFSEGADGAGWSEGVGILVLKRLSDAERDGDTILAVIKGSAVNQDGRSQGLTAPNGPSQERVIRRALAMAGLQPEEIDAVEAHGTGTALGDPIEANALSHVFGDSSERRGHGLWLGSCKSNIGHAQAAAGVLGVIKMVLALQHQRLPQTLHCQKPSPHIDWANSGLSLLQEAQPWPRREGHVRRCGVSSFGISGTNAHLILEEAPVAGVDSKAHPGGGLLDRVGQQFPLLLSARTPKALREQAARWADWLSAQEPLDYDAVLRTAALGRTHFEHRAALLGTPEEAIAGLRALCEERSHPALLLGQKRPAEWGKTVFVFPGQGSQWEGMGKTLLRESPVFAQAIEQCQQALQPYLDWSLLEVLEGRPQAPSLQRVDVLQPALFAMAIGLAALWQDLGIRPEAVVGHSQGEIAAAVVAGALSLEDGARIVALRSRLLLSLTGQGGMAHIELPLAEVENRLSDYPGLSVAVVNTPNSTVVSGDTGELQTLLEQLETQGGFGRRIEVDYASHSAFVQPILQELQEALQGLVSQTPDIPMLSTVTGRNVEPAELDAAYWCRNLRQPVRLDLALSNLRESGHQVLIEISPHPVLALPLSDTGALVAASCRRQHGELAELWRNLSLLHTQGYPVPWSRLLRPGPLVDLPTYAFQRERYWLGETRQTTSDLCYRESWIPIAAKDLRDAPSPLPTCWLVGEPPLAWRATIAKKAFGSSLSLEEALERLSAWQDSGLSNEPKVVVYFPHPALDEMQATWEAVRLAQAMRGSQARLWLVTPCSLALSDHDFAATPKLQALWGLGRALGLEEPGLFGGLLDLSAGPSEVALEAVLPYLLQEISVHDEIALRDGIAWTRRLVRADLPGRTGRTAWIASGPILITGGTGFLGTMLAHWLAQHGGRELILVSRRGATAPGTDELIEALQKKGCRALALACDLRDAEAVDNLVARHPDLQHVFHLAGQSSPAPLAELTPEVLAAEIEAKVAGAWHLHDALLRHQVRVESFLLFGSAAGCWGAGGQLAYSAANAALQGLVQHRRGQSLAASIVHWGRWPEGGLVNPAAAASFDKRGILTMPAEQAFDALEKLLCQELDSLVVSRLDWKPFVRSYCSARPRPLLADLPEAREALESDSEPQDSKPQASPLASRLLAMDPSRRYSWMLQLVEHEVAQVLGMEPGQAIPSERPLQELGLDSLMALELRNRLVRITDLPLAASLAFDYSTTERLCRYLQATVLQSGSPQVPSPSKAASEPLAVIGMACRTPGEAAGPEDFWQLLNQGRDAVGPFPARWLGAECATREGGALSHVEAFDAAFFGIAPREAKAMDPQQRLVLEVAWEALERSGIEAHRLKESSTGVYLGTQRSDYAALEEESAGYQGTGQMASVVSGRLAYTLDLQGPAITVDTACSSSLVALHLACNGLRQGECDLALAGGVQIMSTPGTFVETSHQGVLAPDGRCKAFSEGADGAGWSEGVGILVLKRLSEAERDGNTILAVIKGSAVNQDGRSQGLTAPNGPSQERVIRRALAMAGLQPEEIDAVEAHGTGTALGDPIEANALSQVFGDSSERRGHGLWLGSSKSNIGHAQAAAGVLGVIKMILALQHESLPKTLHCQKPSPHIDWDGSGLSLLQEAQPWPRREGHVRRCGVSSFGISGTNAHLILEEAPWPQRLESQQRPPAPEVLPLLLSGKTAEALLANARRLAQHLQEHSDVSPLDLAWSLATTRTHFEVRRGVTVRAGDAQTGYAQLRRELLSLDSGLKVQKGGLAILFTGQGSQRPGMGFELLDQPGLEVFTQQYERLLEACSEHLPRPLREVIVSGEELEQTRYAQPALFCLEVALFGQWQAWGLQPQLLLGHSVGELSAAFVAGCMSLDQAVRLVSARGRLMQELATPGGAMLSVSAGVEELNGMLAKSGGAVEVAALNGPKQTVLCGDAEAIAKLSEELVRSGLRVKRLAVSHAFHSRHMEPMLEAFRELASQVSYSLPNLPIISNLTGEPLPKLDADYLVSQVRRTVLFGQGLEKARELGVTTFLECGPGAALSLLAEDGIPSLGQQGELEGLMAAAGRLYEQQQSLDWNAFFQPFGPRRVDLPTYAFQRERYWPQAPPSSTESPCYRETWKPLPESPLAKATSGHCWLVSTSPCQPWLEALEELGISSRCLSPEQALSELASAPADLTLLYLPEPSADGIQACCEALTLAQAALDAPGTTLWLITPQSLSGTMEENIATPELQALWGLGRALALEQPRLFGGLLDLPLHATSAELLEAIPYLLQETAEESEVLLRRGRLWGRRLVRANIPPNPTRWTAKGPVLITGGTGHLGSVLSKWLVDHGATDLLLVSRQGPAAPGAQELADALNARGCRVVLASCDLTDQAQTEGLLAKWTGLKHVFHLAGSVGTAPLREITTDSLQREMAAKVRGAWSLQRALERHTITLDSFVLFGSVAGFWGSGGQLAYSAANSALQGLAQWRKSQGQPATIVHWGPWPEGGMAGTESARFLSRRGILPLQPEIALNALDYLLEQPEPALAVVNVDWTRFAPLYTSARPRPLLAEIMEAQSALMETAPGGACSSLLVQQLAELEESQRLPWMLRIVREETADVLGMSSLRDIPNDRALQELGLDSIMALELRGRLMIRSGLSLSSTLAFSYPTPEELARHIIDRLSSADSYLLANEARQAQEILAEIPPEELRRSGLLKAILSWRVNRRETRFEEPQGSEPDSEDFESTVLLLKSLLEDPPPNS